MNVYTEIEVDGYERVIYCENNKVKLRSWIAIHDTTLGPSLGGCRMWNYGTSDEALTDVLRLSKGMTYKNALAGLDFGGGKSVIWGDSKTEKTPELFAAMGEFVDYVRGTYIIAEDVGISVDDVMIMHQKTKHTAPATCGDPGPYTAYGVVVGIKAACKFKYGTNDLSGISIHVQGAGSVGLALINGLVVEGAHVIVTDINQDALDKAELLGGIPSGMPSSCTSFNCDVFAPCALGAVINDRFLGGSRYRIIAGSANNQLLEERHGKMLHDMGILYAPDYVINSGGVIMVSSVVGGLSIDHDIYSKINIIGDTLTEIFEESDRTGQTTDVIANKLAEKRLGWNK